MIEGESAPATLVVNAPLARTDFPLVTNVQTIGEYNDQDSFDVPDEMEYITGDDTPMLSLDPASTADADNTARSLNTSESKTDSTNEEDIRQWWQTILIAPSLFNPVD